MSGFRSFRNPHPVGSCVGSGVSGTHALWVPEFPEPTPVGSGISRTHTLWVPGFPEPTPVGSGVSGTHTLRPMWVRPSSEPTLFWSFIFGGWMCSRVLADSPRLLMFWEFQRVVNHLE